MVRNCNCPIIVLRSVSLQFRQNKKVLRRTENAWKSYSSIKERMKGNHL